MKNSQGFDCETEDENWMVLRIEKNILVMRMHSGDEYADCTIGLGQVENLIEFLIQSVRPSLKKYN